MSEGRDEEFAALLADAHAGSAEALGALIERVRPDLRTFLRQSLGPRLLRYQSSSDLEQDVLLGARELVKRLPADAGPSDLRALVLRHAHWAIGKAARRSVNIVGESAGEGAEPADSVPTTGDVTAAEELRRFQELVARLPRELAEVIRLRGEELSFERIGALLGIGADAARKRFLKGARLLRERRPGS